MGGESRTSPFLVLNNLELLLAQKKYNEALMLFTSSLPLLGTLHSASWMTRNAGVPDWSQEGGELCQRLAAVWRALLTSPADLSRLDANALVANLDSLHLLLMATYEGHLDSYSRSLHAKLQGRFQPVDVLRLLLAWTPGSQLEWSPFDYAHILPDVVAAQALATLACRVSEPPSLLRAREAAIALLASGRIDIRRITKFNATELISRAWLGLEGRNDDAAIAARAFLVEAGRQTAGLQGVTLDDESQCERATLVLVEAGIDPFQCDRLCLHLGRVTGRAKVLVALGHQLPERLREHADHAISIRYSGVRLAQAWQRLAALFAEWRPDEVLWPHVSSPVWRTVLDGVNLAREVRVLPVGASWQSEACAPAPHPGERLRLFVPAYEVPLSTDALAALRALEDSPELATRITLVFGLGGNAIRVMATRHTVSRSLLLPEFCTVNSADDLAVAVRQCHAVVGLGAGEHAPCESVPVLDADQTLPAGVAALLAEGHRAA